MKFGIAARLSFSFGVMLVLIGAVATTSIVQMRVMDTASSNVLRSSKNEIMAAQLAEGINNMRRYQLSALVTAGAERKREL